MAPSTADDTWSIYWTGWQYLWCAEGDETPVDPSNGVPDRRGLGLFARAGVGDDDTLPIDFHVSGGLGGRGLVAGRPDDHFGLGYFYNDVRPNRLLSLGRIENNTQGFEAFYNAALTPAARLTVSVQVADDADARTDTAVTVGGRLQLTF